MTDVIRLVAMIELNKHKNFLGITKHKDFKYLKLKFLCFASPTEGSCHLNDSNNLHSD